MASKDETQAGDISIPESQNDSTTQASNEKKLDYSKVAHDLRTPLNSILGWATLIEMNPGNEDILNRGIAAIIRSTKLQEDLIKSLFDI